MRTWVFDIPRIPDLTHHSLRALHPGDLREHLAQRAGQWLRMIGRFREDEATIRFRGDFDPGASQVQDRLRWSVHLSTAETVSEAAIRSITSAGPVGPFYRFAPRARPAETGAPTFDPTAVCEITRREEAYHPLVKVTQNRWVPEVYYIVQPFEPNGDNDWLLLDRVLSDLDVPVAIDLAFGTAEAHTLRECLLDWITNLLAVNAHDDTAKLLDDEGLPEGFTFSDDRQGLGFSAPAERKTRDPLVEEFLRENQELFQNLRKPQFRFSLRVAAPTTEAALSVGSVVAESCFCEGRYQVVVTRSGEAGFESAKASFLVGTLEGGPDAAGVLPQGGLSRTAIIHDLRALARVATAEELSGAFRLPSVSGIAARTMRSSTDPAGAEPPATSVLVGHDMETGVEPDEDLGRPLVTLFDAPASRTPHLRLSHDLFKKHLFIAGAPGSGKTTAVFNLLVQLHRHGIPFLVIEPAKTEYRALKALREHSDPVARALARDLRVFTPGNEALSPLRFNPFEYPADRGISRDEHLALVMSSFKAGIPMWGPLEAIIADAIEEAYDRLPDGRAFPTMADVVAVAREIAAGKGYEGEVKSNIEAAIGVRLESLIKRSVGRIFSEETSFPSMADLVGSPGLRPGRPTIIELEHMPGESACLLTLFILSALREWIRVTRASGSDLQHVIVIEEAHNIVGRTGDAKGGEDSADPRAFAAQYIARMLAELRALGEGIIIADQLPSTVAPEVIKNTGTKLAGRLVSADDREELGATMLLDPAQIEEIARLGPGEAFLYHERLHRPRRVRALNAARYLGLEGTEQRVAGHALVGVLRDDEWFQEMLRRQVVNLTEPKAELERGLDDLRVVLDIAEKSVSAKNVDLKVAGVVESNVLPLYATAKARYKNCRELVDQVEPRVKDVGSKPNTKLLRDFLKAWNAIEGRVAGVVARADDLLDRLAGS